MLRSPRRTCGDGSLVIHRLTRRSCQTFQNGTNDRWVFTTVNGPAAVSTTAPTAIRGSSSTSRVLRRPCGSVIRIGARPGTVGSLRTCQLLTGRRETSATPYIAGS